MKSITGIKYNVKASSLKPLRLKSLQLFFTGTMCYVYVLCTRWSVKTGHYIIGDNLVQCEPIFIFFALLRRKLNFQQSLSNISHFALTITMVPTTLGNAKD